MELETKVFAQPDVRARLANHIRLFVDLSDEDDDAEVAKVKGAFAVATLPAVLVYPRARTVLSFVLGQAPRPPASLALTELVSAAEFLKRLRP